MSGRVVRIELAATLTQSNVRWSNHLRLWLLWSRRCHFCATLLAMKSTIDSAGRIVVPKPLRQALGLQPGQVLEIRAGDGRLEIELAATTMMLKRRGKGVVAVPETDLPPLTAEQARETLERVRW
jgi:AbrB family looped-hinge helix DNA binding protein